jgi:hypothetical protein
MTSSREDQLMDRKPEATQGGEHLVVIATHDRHELLRATLRSLGTQLSRDFSVAVLDHGGSEDYEVLRGVLDAAIPLVLVPIPAGEIDNDAGQVRNRALSLIASGTISFVDCGLLLEPTYIGEHAEVVRRTGGCAVSPVIGALREDDWVDAWIGPVEMAALADSVQGMPGYGDPRCLELGGQPHLDAGWWPYCWAGSLSLPASRFREAGGFPHGSGWGFEDLELGLALEAGGCSLAFCESRAVHLPHERVDTVTRLSENRDKFRQALARHPRRDLEVFGAFGTACLDSWLLGRLGEVWSRDHPDEADGWTTQPRLVIGLLEDGEPTIHASHGGGVEERLPLFGIRTPFPADAFAEVVITEVWRHLDFPVDRRGPSVLMCLLSEAIRVGCQVRLLNRGGSTAEAIDAVTTVRNLLMEANANVPPRLRLDPPHALYADWLAL